MDDACSHNISMSKSSYTGAKNTKNDMMFPVIGRNQERSEEYNQVAMSLTILHNVQRFMEVIDAQFYFFLKLNVTCLGQMYVPVFICLCLPKRPNMNANSGCVINSIF